MVVFAWTTGYSIILLMGQHAKQLPDSKSVVVGPLTGQLLIIHCRGPLLLGDLVAGAGEQLGRCVTSYGQKARETFRGNGVHIA